MITLYDIPSDIKVIAWSPNTWKTRFALQLKGLEFETVWIEYPDIADLCKKIGAAPSGTKDDGSPDYTLPVIHDSSTNTVVSESGLIARYLDKAYPNTPALIPQETDALHGAFQEAFLLTIEQRILPLMLPPTNAYLHPPSEAYFRRTREAKFGKKMEEISPGGPVREAQWEKLRGGLTKLAEWLELDGKEKLFFTGDRVSHADLSIAGWLIWIKLILGVDSAEWLAVKTWDGGRWGRFMEHFEQYEKVW
ncbi:hypothetical protein WOLCODRAFT_150218 [Wolfiporia cocos MD-104 SS10]|uniref:GST N-terminal domain-containing protein n=1 Tax=Wolfiporia cocos (strain MD-104) TaxID=742152 RepID=A0A2H3JMZ5_WOLCO|nr:hypothetical protein WOLCODRAFT_150218 [Wolfiporia cocos MD-104 SS10]